ncbi:MAG: response regulator [Lachnospiraceae bacterium]|nr:response regulator [Lachnospiraceae bacterium]
MKIIVIEDEPKTRKGIVKIIEKYTAHEVIADEEDGLLGLDKVLELKPDILITDINMPNMDGLTMIKKIREAGLKTECIILTGYSEFEYAQKSIQLSVVEYLLKPLDIEEIIEVLDNISAKISDTKVETVSPEQLLFSIFMEKDGNSNRIQDKFAEKIKYQNNQKMDLFLVKNESLTMETTNEIVDILKESLNAICLSKYYVLKLPIDKTILVLILDGQNVHYLKEMFQMKVIPDIKKIAACIVSYESISCIDELKNIVYKMQEYMTYAFILDNDKVIDHEMIEKMTFKEIEYPEYLENTVRKGIRTGQNAEVEKSAGEFEKLIIESRETPQIIKQYTARFVLAAMDVAKELLCNEDIQNIYTYLLNDLIKTDSREIFLNNYYKMIHIIIGDRADSECTENGIILNAIAFMRQNYEKDLSLVDVSDVVGITPEYLSKLFSKEMGINFVTFLMEFRISMAKKMLQSSNLKIHEVAERVGYRDTKYFNKVFKSIIGVSPSEYRKKI